MNLPPKTEPPVWAEPPSPPDEEEQKDDLQTDDLQAVAYFKQAREGLTHQLGKVIVGQEEVIDQLLIAIFTRNHALLVGVPGLAKTLLISTLAQTMSLAFKRIQFTPDLMPSDITGTEVIHQDPATRRARSSGSSRGRSSRTWSWPTRSTARRPRPRRRCSRRCRSGA